MTTSLNIAKFGGTSVADHAAMCNCANIVINNPATRVVVVSASAGVTNLLVELANSELDRHSVDGLIEQVKHIQLAIVAHLGSKADVTIGLNGLFDELTTLAHNRTALALDENKDALLCLGERMSSLLFTEVLRQHGAPAQNFDARWVIKTNSQYGQGIPDIAAIKQACEHQMATLLSDNILVTQGFIGSDNHNKTTTLGRGGSDYTAALLAEALGAQTCEIWTDVIGVYTTDPRITAAAQPLPELSFDEAAEMATFGAKVLHPATMVPAVRKNIRVFVGSSREPEKGGTWIAKDCQNEPPYRAITRRKDQVMVTVKTPEMLYAPGFLSQVFGIIANNNISVDLVTTSEIAVSMTIDNPPNSLNSKINQRTIAELRNICEVVVEEGYDLVTVVGNNMHSQAGVSSRIFAALEQHNLRMICYGANPHNMSFLVNAHDSADVVKTLHQALFE